ncbi:MAG: exodeoxyribonuclease VII small subunit [Phycisphaerales bacterium]|nr:exodeoxyribonuclease VII small subunit [Phycisphaerales bacterium]MCB9854870.1 exodeoxyribonuclease VII small subunit [Phycisphaerales bacterium]MCB9865008.1 exodeoxyribonuclease VII small subunit [Phycisphaerales bacterium]
MSKGKFVFEAAIGRAEEIAEAIEQGDIGLEESIKQFEEGMTLIRKCRKVLEDAELRIQTLEASLAEESEPHSEE